MCYAVCVAASVKLCATLCATLCVAASVTLCAMLRATLCVLCCVSLCIVLVIWFPVTASYSAEYVMLGYLVPVGGILLATIMVCISGVLAV